MYVQTLKLAEPIARVRLKGAPVATVAPPTPAVPKPEPARQAEAAQLRELVGSLIDAVHEHESRRQQSLSDLQHLAVDLAVSVASHLIAEAIDAGLFAVEKLVAQAVQKLGLDEPIVVSLHPADLDLLNARLAGKTPEWPPQTVSLRPDPLLDRGDVRADSEDGLALVSRVGTRLAEIRRHWLEGLDDAQVERRRDAVGDRPLRRFPDRRETA